MGNMGDMGNMEHGTWGQTILLPNSLAFLTEQTCSEKGKGRLHSG
jgi:hypothetical protein